MPTSDPHMLRGRALLAQPRLNRDAAFTQPERDALGLSGLLPPAVFTIEQQDALETEHLAAKTDPLEKYVGLIALLERNETLFYRVLSNHLEALAPIIYTPTVGLACQQYSHIFRHPRGLYLTPDDAGCMVERLCNVAEAEIRLIVVTDNERILGLGDQGVGGMAIPVGKLILYAAGASIHPQHCLPVSLDVGTDNAALLEDPFYLGHRAPRLRGDAYDALVEEFVQAVKKVFPRAVLQWEDFKKGNAFRLLEQYREQVRSFNDDIQGTAAVTLAGILSGLKITGESLAQQRILFVGAGGAGVGIGGLVQKELLAQGVSAEEARRKLVFFDSDGVLMAGRTVKDPYKLPFVLPAEDAATLGVMADMKLQALVQTFKPTVLVGTSGQPGVFDAEILWQMGQNCARPIVLPLSNPTSQAECTPSAALTQTDGRALVASGSPFAPVRLDAREFIIGQCNNVFIFPGLGLGLLLCEVERVPDSLFLAAAHAVAEYTQAHHAGEETLYPRIAELRAVSQHVAQRVAQAAVKLGIAPQLDDAELLARAEKWRWTPEYATLSLR
jgi:malic enzyme